MTVKVIYIAGEAYIGSTFLNAVLAAHPHIEGVGELYYWAAEDLAEAHPCSCGAVRGVCSFWASVKRLWFEKAGIQDRERYRFLQNRFENRMFILQLWLNKAITLTPEFKEYAQLTETLFSAIAEVSGRSVIADASKRPGRALALAYIEGLDIHYIHLIRGGLEFLASSRAHAQERKQAVDFFKMPFGSSLHWAFTNLTTELVLHLSRQPSIKLRYEDFICDPAAALTAVGHTFEIEMQPAVGKVLGGQPIPFRHIGDGNQIRMAGPSSLRQNTSRTTNLPGWWRWAFWVLAGLVAKRYHY
jgi:hypothetical protein